MTDQLGTVHSLLRDLLGRLTDDCITTLGSGVDGAVRRISLGYEVRGMLQSIASFDNATPGSGTQLDEVFMAFDDLANPSQEYQEHQGAHTSSSLFVGYNYDSSNSGGFYTKGSRPISLAYPSGRLLDITYGSSGSIADSINRLDKLSDDSGGSPSTTLAAYSYLGLGQIVIEDFQQPQVRLDYYQGTPGTYAGLDLFGRIVSQLWTAYGASAVADQFGYGFDLNSNRVYRAHNNATAQDEFYGYDDLLRLATTQRGTLNSTNTGISGTPAAEFDYTFDATGNWGEYVEKTSGTTSLDQTRSHTEANEISAIGASAGPTWLTPVYDAVGNMTTMPNPADLTAGLNGEYDAWGRLVQVADGTMVLAQFRYDGLNRRIVENLPSGGSTLVRHAYYNSDWQLLETRTGSSSSTPPASLPVEYQYVWSLRYIDAPILRDAPNETGAPRYYFLTDANMNITALLDTSATPQERYLYSPYGAPVIFDGTWSTIRSASAYDNSLLFAGYRFDPATGLYLARNRELHAQLGLWTSRDPIGYGAGTNLYGFVSQSPSNWSDPYGLIESPGFWEGLIPVWGSGKQALHEFECGSWGWGIVYTALAISDVFLVKSLGKGFVKGFFKIAGSHEWGGWTGVSRWLTTRGWRTFKGQAFHHFLIEQNSRIGKFVPNFIKNQPWNLVGLPEKLFGLEQYQIHNILHGIGNTGSFWQRAYIRSVYSTPTWFKSVGVSYGGRIVGHFAAP